MKEDVSAYMRYYNLEKLHSANNDMKPINYEEFLAEIDKCPQASIKRFYPPTFQIFLNPTKCDCQTSC
ncbi:hypothetical protein VIVU109784_17790 [Vibrio vulnificus]